jgi:deoxyribodipyrimidine photo-lyase
MQIWWIRRDLRLEDNPALNAAIQAGPDVLPVFILDEHLLAKPAEKRLAFLFAGLRALETNLHCLGSGLVVRRGDPVVEIPRLAVECGAGVVFAEGDISPYALRRDQAVSRQIDLRLVHGLGVHPVTAVRRADGGVYTIFTPYRNVWKALPFNEQVIPAPIALPPIPTLPSYVIPSLTEPEHFPPTGHEAQRRLAAFLDGPVFSYVEARDRLDIDGTSALSPYLRFGMISARSATSAVIQAARSTQDAYSQAGCEAFLDELVWREFYQSILFNFPHVLTTAFNPAMRNIPWRSSPGDLRAWQLGVTGYPIVDAAMRQLAATGWMHNRARMITASFLVKDLLINWQEGERWFKRMLIDGDPAANNGGWQWTAGTGTDAAPYFRIFNPVLQGKKFDPEGNFVRRWLPELATVPHKYLHAPWEMPPDVQRTCGVVIGRNYPSPIVDHSTARQRTLSAFSKQAR